jgi:hypothetical protein
MEAARTSETLVNFYQTTRCYNPEDSHLRTHRRENLKSYIIFSSLYGLGLKPVPNFIAIFIGFPVSLYRPVSCLYYRASTSTGSLSSSIPLSCVKHLSLFVFSYIYRKYLLFSMYSCLGHHFVQSGTSLDIS